MFFNKTVAKAEAAAAETLIVTTDMTPQEAVRAVIKVFDGRLAGSAVRGSWFDSICHGSDAYTSEISGPASDQSSATLRLQVDPDWNGGGSRIVLDIPKYQLHSQYGLPMYGALQTAVTKRKKAIEKLRPTSVQSQ